MESENKATIAVVMGSEDHFSDSRELLDYGAHALTLDDRLFSNVIAREGGGGVSGVQVAEATRLRAGAVEPLDDGRWATTRLRGTDLGHRIETWLRSVAPVIAGGNDE